MAGLIVVFPQRQRIPVQQRRHLPPQQLPCLVTLLLIALFHLVLASNSATCLRFVLVGRTRHHQRIQPQSALHRPSAHQGEGVHECHHGHGSEHEKSPPMASERLSRPRETLSSARHVRVSAERISSILLQENLCLSRRSFRMHINTYDLSRLSHPRLSSTRSDGAREECRILIADRRLHHCSFF